MTGPDYPHESGDVVVIGPEAFIARDGSVLCYRGRNYVPQPPPDTAREIEAVTAVLGNTHEEETTDEIAVRAIAALDRVRADSARVTRDDEDAAQYFGTAPTAAEAEATEAAWADSERDETVARTEKPQRERDTAHEVDTVARALWLENAPRWHTGFPYERLAEATQEDLRRLARAAIKALDEHRRAHTASRD